MNFESWYADYLEKTKAELKGLGFSVLQLNAIYKLLKASYEAGKMANKSVERDRATVLEIDEDHKKAYREAWDQVSRE